jgi:hypothetical protein
MIKILSSTIALVTEVVLIAIGSLWYYNTRELEPLCVIVAASGALLTTVLLMASQKEPADQNPSLLIEDIESTFGKVHLNKKGKLGDETISIKGIKGTKGVRIDLKDE